MNMDDLKRLDRIENKIDKLVEVVASLARLEERMDAVVQRVDRHGYRLDDQEQHTEVLTEKVNENTSSRNVLERFVWLVIAAIASTVAYMFRE